MNKKPKTIEEIIKKEVFVQIGEYIVPNTYRQFVKITFDEEKVAQQIKQLIADEVIDSGVDFPWDLENPKDAKFVEFLREQQLKKLERL